MSSKYLELAFRPLLWAGLQYTASSLWLERKTITTITQRLATTAPKYSARLALNYFRSLPKKAAARKKFNQIQGFYPPNSLILNPGDHCQLSCKGCITEDMRMGKKSLQKEILTEAIKQGYNLGIRSIAFIGGEPLHPKNRPTILSAIETYPHMFYTIFTNAIGLNNEAIDVAKKHVNVAFLLSCDGFEETNDAIRGNGSYRYVTDGAMKLTQAGIPFGLSTTLRSTNRTQVLDQNYISFWEQNNAAFILYTGFIPHDNSLVQLQAAPTVVLADKINDLQADASLLLLNYGDLTTLRSCRAGDRHLYIETNGDVSPCFAAPLPLGNLHEFSLEEIISNPKLQQFKDIKPNYPQMCAGVHARDEINSLISKP